MSDAYVAIRGALLRSIDDAEMESLDTSTSTEGEHTPTPSPGIPLTNAEFENALCELIDNQKWSSAITHVRQFKRMSQLSGSNLNLTIVGAGMLSLSGSYDSHSNDELSTILNIYAQRLIRDKTGKSPLSSLVRKAVTCIQTSGRNRNL